MAAITALEIGEDFFVDNITDFGAGHGASSATEQTAEDGTGQTTEQHAGWTTDSTNGCASLGAGETSTGTGCCTTYCADSAADTSGGVEAVDVG